MSPAKTTIDWLRFRCQDEPREALEALRPLFGGAGTLLRLEPLQRGILGFQQGSAIKLDSIAVGRMDFGGHAQRGWTRVDMTAKGCEWVQDWEATDLVEDLPSSEIRRLDVALTTWEGEITHERVVQAHKEGRFITKGRPPEMRTIVSTDERAGRTCYVGKREASDKFFRAYEKGLELASKCGLGTVTHIDGKRVEDIYRCELELKAENRPIPWDVIGRRDQYFSGAYPFCADVLPGVEADILMRRKERAPQLELQAALAHLRNQFGNTLFTALTAHHGDIMAVWDKVCGREHNLRLVEAGVLMVDHE